MMNDDWKGESAIRCVKPARNVHQKIVAKSLGPAGKALNNDYVPKPAKEYVWKAGNPKKNFRGVGVIKAKP